MIQQNSPNPQHTKSHIIRIKNHSLPSNDLKQTIKFHLQSHKKLILSVEPLPNPSCNFTPSLLAPPGQSLKVEINKKNSPLGTTQHRLQPFDLKAPSPPKKDNILLIKDIKNHESILKENFPLETPQNHPLENYLKASYLPVQDLEVPIKPPNNPQLRVPKTRTQKKSSKISRYKSPPFISFIPGFKKKDSDLATTSLKEETPFATVRVGSSFNKRIALRNPKNTSYIGAVLECLYHLPNAKNLLQLDEKSPKDPSTNQLKVLLKDFFHLMDTSSAEFINQAAWKITQYLFSNPTNQVYSDCVQIFKAITEELSFNDRIPYKLLSDDIEPLKQSENFHVVEIPIEEYIESLADLSENTNFEPKYLQNLQDFPQIIAIAIKPSSKRAIILQEFSAYSLKGGMRDYEFHAGVLDVQGESSNRSLAVIQCNGRGGSYFKFKDDSVKKVQLNEKFYIPRLILYRSVV